MMTLNKSLSPFLIALAAGVALLALLSSSIADAASPSSLISVDREKFVFRDAKNRSRIFHGTNYVNKGGDFIPGVDENITNLLAYMGMNAVRLGVMLPGLFPTPDGKPRVAYLDHIENIVDMLWSKGIYSVIDLHQDVLGATICGEGTPEWMWNVSELHALDFPEPMAFSNTSKPGPDGGYSPAPNCAARGIAKLIGWSGFYMTDASGKAFSQLYQGTSTIGKYVALYWKIVSKRFSGHPGILFYELLNEPWLGDHVGDPLLLLKGGEAERKAVGPYMKKMESIVHENDPLTPVLFSPGELNNRLMRSVGYDEGFLSGNPMAFHVYCVVGTDGPG